MELRVVGRLPIELITYYKNILEYFYNNTSEIILFCDFSEFAIAKNHLFKHIRINNNIVECPILLKSISQEYMLPFESIPIGWKTVCKFEILETGKIELFSQLPEIQEWAESNTCFVLS